MTDDNSAIDFSMVLAASVHDMKNSIGMLLASLEETIDEAPPADAAQTKRFNTLHYEASRINGELVQLLTIYRMKNQLLPLRLDAHYALDVLEDQIARNHMLLETGGIGLQLRCQETLQWHFDNDLIGSVLHNVLVNCIRYTKSCISLGADIVDDCLCFTVADDGPGYPPEMLARPSGLVEEAEVNKGGTHLGLYFAERIAQMHHKKNRHGYIRLENGGELGGGIFTLCLP